MSATQAPVTPRLSRTELETLGYVIDDEGKVITEDDMPISQVYGVLKYWGGDRQHKRWHLTAPVVLDPSRKGDPYFMDENMVAFGADWEGFDERSMLELIELLKKGVKGSKPPGAPVLVDVCWVE